MNSSWEGQKLKKKLKLLKSVYYNTESMLMNYYINNLTYLILMIIVAISYCLSMNRFLDNRFDVCCSDILLSFGFSNANQGIFVITIIILVFNTIIGNDDNVQMIVRNSNRKCFFYKKEIKCAIIAILMSVIFVLVLLKCSSFLWTDWYNWNNDESYFYYITGKIMKEGECSLFRITFLYTVNMILLIYTILVIYSIIQMKIGSNILSYIILISIYIALFLPEYMEKIAAVYKISNMSFFNLNIVYLHWGEIIVVNILIHFLGVKIIKNQDFLNVK